MLYNQKIWAKGEVEAVALDLDGVVTDTKELHFKAWKSAFDDFIKDDQPFEENDYLEHVDGKSRQEGARSFLEFRLGRVDEKAVRKVCEIKNERYLKLLEKIGPRVYEDALVAIKEWKKHGVPVAIVSSSKNTPLIISLGGLEDLFDARVDGNVGERDGLRSKPEPDYFIEAVRRLGSVPDKSLIVEDALAGVMAGKKGKFKWVIGINRSEDRALEKSLKESGADMVVGSLFELLPRNTEQRSGQ